MGEETQVQSSEASSAVKVQSAQEEIKLSAVENSLVANDDISAVTTSVAVTNHIDPEPEPTPRSIETAKVAQPVAAAVNVESNVAPSYVYDAIARIAPQEGFTPGQFRVTFEVGSAKGDGFVAEMFRARIVEGSREMVILCKIPPTNDVRRKQFNSMAIFEREVLAYSSLIPTIYEFQRDKGITDEQGVGFFNTPHCYFAYCDLVAEQSVIAMNDLRLKGYRMWNKMIPVNYEHAKLLMIQLGRLHAVSFALKDQRPEVFEKFKVPDIMTTAFDDSEPFKQMMFISVDRALTTLEEHEEKVRQKVLKMKNTMFEDMVTLTKSEMAEPYAVLGHGDCWINNMMYSYKKGVPTEVILLDWQICRYVSPALDLLYFLFCCTDGEFRAAHYDEMIRIYYASLKTLLEKLGGDPTRQFPYTALLRQLKQCGKFGLIMAVFLVPMMCIENSDLPDLDAEAEKFRETQKVEMPFVVNEKAEAKYRKRMSAVIRDVIRYGYL
ncbi:uncharacterized protein LOC131685633 [Topomyia yanbarensis]|uniref:uncharacterized protein LOC131685633 n=1 Tax=Topomyia yanbarensis TaxID=2498891 RepID=UPI00273CA687|nr:uncharacterized protein LOC131685633 [Topomyia yanbarensis]